MCGIVEIRIRRLKTTAQDQSPGDPRNNATSISLDLAKSIFQVHAIAEDGSIVMRRGLRRSNDRYSIRTKASSRCEGTNLDLG
ncbi:hypothetical protein CN080_33785 [Sinorhizobium meliloti]|nr:hypothetical protein CN080_33785 [Sinorhizobium meliloti]